MGLFDSVFEEFNPLHEDDARRHYEDIYMNEQPRHQSSLTHEGAPCYGLRLALNFRLTSSCSEAVAAAAGFAAMHAYESHLRATGQPVTHEKMKVSSICIQSHCCSSY